MEEDTQEYLDGKADTPADDEMLQNEQADDKTSSKQEKFKELATKRTNDICHRIQQLGKLAKDVYKRQVYNRCWNITSPKPQRHTAMP